MLLFGHSTPKCVEKERKKKRERDTWKERGKNIRHLICDKSKTLLVCVFIFSSLTSTMNYSYH